MSAVLVFHGGFSWASGGFLGVSSFFTLSGFLITSLLIAEREQNGRIALLAFWDRRFRRLLPAALAALSGVALYGATLADTDQLWRLRGDTLSALAYVANWRFLVTGQAYEALFSAPSPVQHFWSLAIEEQYYLLFPPLVIALYSLQRGRFPLVVAFASLALASTIWMSVCLEPDGPISRAYYGTDTRAAELLVGALLAAVWHGRGGPSGKRGRLALQSLGVCAVLVSIAAWGFATPHSRWLFHGGLAGYALASAALVAAALQPGPLASLLSTAPLRGLGRISYGVYLYHWPIFLSLDPERIGLEGGALFALRIAATIGVSIVSYRFLERPVRLGRLRGDPRVWLAVPCGMLAVASLQWAVTKDLAVPWYAERQDAAVDEEPVARAPAQGAGGRGAAVERALRAGVPRKATRRLAWVVGDSAGLTFAPGLKTWGKAGNRLGVHSYARLGCSLVRGGTIRGPKGVHTRPERCESWEETWAAGLDEHDPDLVLVMAGIWDLFDRKLAEWPEYRSIGDPIFDAHLLAEYRAAVDLLSSRGALVLFVNQPCADPEHPDLRPGGRLAHSPALSNERISIYNEELLPRLARSRPHRMRLIDLNSEMCPGGSFPADGDRYSASRADGVHYTSEGALEVARWLGPRALSSYREWRGGGTGPRNDRAR